MDFLTILLSGATSWFLLVSLYMICRRIGFTDSAILDQIPFPHQDSPFYKKINLSVHFLFSLIFTFVYVKSWQLLDFIGDQILMTGLITGFIHGIAVSIGFFIMCANDNNGPKKVIVIMVAHLIFGLISASFL
jgi:hypothetical protein